MTTLAMQFFNRHRDALERAPEWRSVSVLASGALLQALMALAMVWVLV